MRTTGTPSSNSSKNKYRHLLDPLKPLVLTMPVDATLMTVNGWDAHPAEGFESVTLTFKRRQGISHYPVHGVRDQFLLVSDMAEATEFFSLYGPLYKKSAEMPTYTMKQIRSLQEDVRQKREMSAFAYFRATDNDFEQFFESFPLTAKLALHRVPFLSIEVDSVVEAIRSATYLDQIAGVRAASCKQCGRQFSWGPKDKAKTYCSLEHQRAHSKDEWNKRQKEGKNAKAGK